MCFFQKFYVLGPVDLYSSNEFKSERKSEIRGSLAKTPQITQSWKKNITENINIPQVKLVCA